MAVARPTANPAIELLHPPASLVWGAGTALAVSLGLLFPRELPTSIAGYLLAPLVVTVLVSLYRYRDARASQSNLYSQKPGQMKVATAVMALSFIVGLGHAWIIATVVAKAMA